jgi:hypothetical protein
VVDLQPRGCEFDASPFDNHLSIKISKKGEIEHRCLLNTEREHRLIVNYRTQALCLNQGDFS